MADATKCGHCNYVYWTSWNENWGVCPKCGTDNDRYKGPGSPKLVEGKWIFKYYDKLLDKVEQNLGL